MINLADARWSHPELKRLVHFVLKDYDNVKNSKMWIAYHPIRANWILTYEPKEAFAFRSYQNAETVQKSIERQWGIHMTIAVRPMTSKIETR